ncbi:beta-L-arabinofuranosidase domain-containing protein [Microbacterium panaciterrae]|uniref:Glycoside hydrolase family 127 protein n=1 Tax=Microbacterium panaciterrae TaxID=985759 RepID=A0ABP8PPW2_9MICO
MTALTFAPLSAVRLLPSAFAHAEQVNLEAILRLDPHRLLAPFRREAGLQPTLQPYGGWESAGLGGHTAGHILSALAYAIATTEDPRAVLMLNALIEGLTEAQVTTGTGYIGGVPDGISLWDELRRGTITATPFELNGRWVPLYNLHKTLLGLLDVAEYTPTQNARDVLDRFARWWRQTLVDIDDSTLELILTTEFGGLTGTFSRLALLQQDPHYLDLAMRFTSRPLLEPLLRGQDALNGLHANTRIPVVVGYATTSRAARALGVATPQSEGLANAARIFFDSVAEHRSTAIGGNSVREHFPPRNDFSSVFLAREGPESCNTINMIELASELYLLSNDDALLDFIENAQVNHVLSTQHPEHGGVSYFTSHRPGHYRVYSPEQDGFWCCMGSGYQAHARHGSTVYAVGQEEVRVLRFIPSELELAELGLRIRQESNYPAADTVRMTITAERPVTVAVRLPEWMTSLTVRQNGGAAGAVDASWWRQRLVEGVHVIDFLCVRRLELVRAPDESPWGWLRYGPSVIAQRVPDESLEYRATGARTAHIASGPLLPLSGTPILSAHLDEFEALDTARVAVRSVTGERIELEPFAALHDARYRLSWPISDSDGSEADVALEEWDRASTSLEARVVDSVIFGEQQPESDHALHAVDSTTGIDNGRHWRRLHRTATITLTDWGSIATALRLEWLSEPEPTSIRLRLAGTTLWEQHLDGSSDGDVLAKEFPLPSLRGKLDLEIELIALDDRPTPRLLRVLLLTEVSDRF